MYSKNLGATLKKDGSGILRVWSPESSVVNAIIYNKDNPDKVICNLPMKKGPFGIWELFISKKNSGIDNLNGYYYQYEVLDKSGPKLALDPYAKSMSAFNFWGEERVGKGAFVDLNSPEAGIKPKSIGNSNLKSKMEMISYEVHIRDFTIGTNVPNRGTYKGFSEYEDGIHHLKELGITHVQLLPIHSFYTVNERDKELTLSGKGFYTNYNWGYDPHNYFTPEGWYSTNPNDPYSRIREFRELVNRLHQEGIGVIMDVVYNHTYQNSILHNIAQDQYYREPGGTTPVGDSALATEKPMVQKLILDSLKFFVDEYGVDGFRFDLMGFIDKKTLKKARLLLGDKIILYGEAWNYTDLKPGLAPVKGITNLGHHKISDLSYFNDTSRDSFAGWMDTPGFVQCNFYENPRCKAGIIGGLKKFDNGGVYVNINSDDYNRFALSPSETLQYLTIHDGFTLWDKINISHKGDKKEKIAIVKQAMAMLFTSQGKIVIQGGCEIARTKPLSDNDPEPNRVNRNTENIINEGFGLYFHENSYKSPDYTNMYRWERKNDPLFNSIFKYLKGLINIRKKFHSLRYKRAVSIQKGLRFFGDSPEDKQGLGYIAYTLDNRIEGKLKNLKYIKFIVVHNAESSYLKVKCPDLIEPKNWDILLDGEIAGVKPILNSDVLITKNYVTLPPHVSTLIGLKKI